MSQTTYSPPEQPEHHDDRRMALAVRFGRAQARRRRASWCRPCREENPNVVAAFQKFRNKNFTILGVSLDKNKDAWKKAIMKDGLTWQHISDLQEWYSPVVPLYGIQGIPFNVLVNPEGNIIAKNLRGSELHEKLTEVLQ